LYTINNETTNKITNSEHNYSIEIYHAKLKCTYIVVFPIVECPFSRPKLCGLITAQVQVSMAGFSNVQTWNVHSV